MREISNALELTQDFRTVGHGALGSRYRVTELATNAVAAVGCAIASLMEGLGVAAARPAVVADRRLASLWFAQSIDPVGWELPPVWDAIAGDYWTQDGWIKLHTNLPAHRQAACKVLGVRPERAAVEAAVSAWRKDDLETAIAEGGGVSGAMRTRSEWIGHPQGAAVAKEPLIIWSGARKGRPRDWPATIARPLAGLRVMDLTRVLAGPVATRTLAGFGAEVLRLDPPDWEEPNVVPDITLGKRCARLDLGAARGREVFEQLLSEADILVHGYRPGALAGLGFDAAWRRGVAPHLIEVSLNAYGWSGPWSVRRGFDSLVQMSSGIADAGMGWANEEKPVPLPVQALDHATGYLMAAAVIKSVDAMVRGDPVRDAQLSLARTAELLIAHEQAPQNDPIAGSQPADFTGEIEQTPWGPARRLAPPVKISETTLNWRSPSCALGSSPPQWD